MLVSLISRLVACSPRIVVDKQRQTHRTTTVTLAAHARRGLILYYMVVRRGCWTPPHLVHWRVFSTKLAAVFYEPLSSTRKHPSGQRVFSSLAIDDIYDISIIQQCRMLESELDTCVLAKCLSDPENAPNIVKKSKEYILRSDFRNLLASTSNSLTSAAPAAHIATHTSWRRLWDIALDKGVKGTRFAKHLQGALSSSLMF